MNRAMNGTMRRITSPAGRQSHPAHVAVAGLLALLLTGTAAAEPARRPNVVILYADDMGVGDIAAANPDSKIPTPHLDRLAREGTRFTDAHSSSGICTPSRYALLHGRYHWRKFHGIVNAFDQPVLDPERTTLAELLAGQGYRTACIGKWHLGWDWNAIRRAGVEPRREGRQLVYAADAFDWSKPIPGGPLAHGFDSYFGDDVPNFPPYAWVENDRVVTPPTVGLATAGRPAEGGWEARPGPAVADWDFHAVMPRLVRRAVEWIGGQDRDVPFFLYFPFTSPHAPIVPAAEFAGRSRAGGYGDFVAQTDAAVGAVLEALEARGLLDETLVIFTADNGPEAYAYERVRAHGHRSMDPLRGVKRDLWEGGTACRSSSAGRAGIDIFATVAGFVGAAIPPDTGDAASAAEDRTMSSAEDSIDQRACFTGMGPSARDTLVHNTNPGGYAIRHGDWVLIDAPSGGISAVPRWFDEANGYAAGTTGAGRGAELYDLRADPGQHRDRLADEPDRAADMRRRLAAIRRGAGE
jgi:arylsulfatase A